MATLDDLMKESQGATQGAGALDALVNETAAAAPVAPAPQVGALDSLLQQDVAADPSLDTKKEQAAGDINNLTINQLFAQPDKVGSLQDLFVKDMQRDSAINAHVAGTIATGGARSLIQSVAGLGEMAKTTGNIADAVDAALTSQPTDGIWQKGIKDATKQLLAPILAHSQAMRALSPLSYVDKAEAYLPDPPDNLADMTLEGIGQAGAMIGGAKAASWGASKFGPLTDAAAREIAEATALAMGVGGGAEQQVLDARENGATQGQQDMSTVLGGMLGSTDAIPGVIFLRRLAKATKLPIMEKLANLGMKGEPSTFGEVVRGFLLEGGQEGAQQVGQNYVAKDLAGYDPNRTLGENVLESIVSGGAVGSLFGGIAGIKRAGARDAALADLEAQFNSLVNNPINTVGAEFTPVSDLVQQNLQNKTIEDELLRAGTEEEIAQQVGNHYVDPNLPKDKQTEQYAGSSYDAVMRHGGPDVLKGVIDEPVDAVVEKGLPKHESGRDLTVREALDVTPIVAAKTAVYDELLKQVEDAKKKTQEKIDSPLTPAGMKDVFEKLLVKQDEAVKAIKWKMARVPEIMGHAKDLISSLQRALGPDTAFVIRNWNHQNHDNEVTGRTSGHASLTYDVPLPSGRVVNVSQIYLDFDRMATAEYNARFAKGSWDSAMGEKRRLFEVLVHEFGHSIHTKLFGDLQTMQGTSEEQSSRYLIMQALRADYRQWLKDRAGDSLQSMYDHYFGPQSGKNIKANLELGGTTADKMLSDLMKRQDSIGSYIRYTLSAQEFFAERTARMAAQGDLGDAALNKYFANAVEKYQQLFAGLPSFAQDQYAGNWREFLRLQVGKNRAKEMIEAAQGGGAKDIFSALKGLVPGFDPKEFAGYREHLDRFTKFMAQGLNILQLEKELPHIQELGRFRQSLEAWQAYQRSISADALEAHTAWRNLGKVESAKMSEVFFEEALQKGRLTQPELEQRLSPEALKVYSLVRAQLDRILNEMRAVALADAQNVSTQGPEHLAAELKEINEEFDKMLSRGYFPFLRFGKYTITAYAKEDLEYEGKKYKKGKIIDFSAYEKEGERNKALSEMKAALGDKASVSASVMAENEFVLQGMPRSMLAALRRKMELTGAKQEHLKQVDEMLKKVSAFSTFKKHMLKKKGIAGYSEDGLRSFAFYMRSAASHIARVRYAAQLQEPVEALQQQAKALQLSGRFAQVRQQLSQHLQEHMQYVMNPGNEWNAIRSLVFIQALGFNVKSALVNSTQLMTTGYPYLAARYGDAQALKALTSASWQVKDWFTKRKEFIAATKNQRDAFKAKLAYAIRRGDIGAEGAHFATRGASTYFDDRDTMVKLGEDFEEQELGYYDLSNLNIANTQNADIAKQIIQKRIELAQQAKEGSAEALELEDIDNLNELLQEGDPFIDYRVNEETRLYLGAKALGYDGMNVVESDDAPGDATTIYAFQKLNKVKKLTKEEWNKNKAADEKGELSPKARKTKLYARGMHEGWIDQSLATEIAIAASENNLDRGWSVAPGARRFWHNFSRWSALPFHVVEKFNRLTLATAAYDLEYERSQDHERAVQAAKMANYGANYENSRWNRPKFMQGKKGVAMMFAGYVQNSLYFATRDPGALRWYLMMMLMAGAMGMPFAEDAIDLADFLGTYFKRTLGMKNPKVELRAELREAIQDIGMNPDLILHGISQDSFGWGQVGELTGLPIPRLDLSASMGMGNIVPGTELLSRFQTQKDGPALGDLAVAAGGATGNIVQTYYSAMLSTSPDQWKNAEKLLPLIALRNASKGLRLFERGGEFTAASDPVAAFNAFDPRDRMELAAQGLGFTPRKLTLGWEREMAQRDLVGYYKVQSGELQTQLNWAILNEDREARADVMKEITRYNTQVPYPEMRMQPKDIKASVKSYVESHLKAGAGAGSARYSRLMKSIEAAYPTPPVDKEDMDQASRRGVKSASD